MRKVVAVLLAVLVLGASVAGCSPEFRGLHLRIAAGNTGGVYYQLSQRLAAQWGGQLGIARPEVLETRGSPDNLARLRAGTADVAFSAADVAAITAPPNGDLKALARIYDDYLHVVVRADSPITSLAALRGHRVSIGAPDSGVAVIAKQLLHTAGLSGPGALTTAELGLDTSLTALQRGEIDAFFWSGGLPTNAITAVAQRTPLRLVDIGGLMPQMRRINPVYRTATIPASTYQTTGGPVVTLAVPNYLMVPASMPDDLAEALVQGLFAAQGELAKANRAALSIDVRSAIETAPLALHPGALRYYRGQKT